MQRIWGRYPALGLRTPPSSEKLCGAGAAGVTSREALQALDDAIVEQERERWAQACRIRDEAVQVARDALARWAQVEKERRK